MSNEVAALEADSAAWRERTAALAILLESEKAALTACGLARAAKERADDAAKAAGGPSGAKRAGVGGWWPEAWGDRGPHDVTQPQSTWKTWYHLFDLTMFAQESIDQQFGAPFGEVVGKPGHDISILRQEEGLPSPSRAVSGSPDEGAGSGGTGGGVPRGDAGVSSSGSASPFGPHLGSDPNARVGSDPNARVGSDSNANVGSNPAASVGSNPSAPVGSNPAANVAADPNAPTFGVNNAPIGSDPNADVGSDPNAPVGGTG